MNRSALWQPGVSNELNERAQKLLLFFSILLIQVLTLYDWHIHFCISIRVSLGSEIIEIRL